ncbi:MAG TPA: alpha/beta hydrolase [Balneolales bacterium]|nr:alpha/beta hydrolase [Balneolales bacterium]
MATEHNTTYRDRKLHYYVSGEGKPLVVLHGWGASGKLMLPLAQSLSSMRKCIIPDLPGFGESDEPSQSWSVDDYANCILTLIDELGFRSVDILAHSLGGRITLKLCARQQIVGRFDKVLITGGAGMKPRRSAKFYFKKYFAKLLKIPFAILPEPAQSRQLDKLRKTSLWKSLGSSDYQQLQGVMRETFVKVVSEYLEPCLPQINHEILLIWGTNDDTTPLYQAERMNEGLRNSALVTIKEAGHYAFLDQPYQFQRIAEVLYKG